MICNVFSIFYSIAVLKMLIITHYFITQYRCTTQLETQWANNLPLSRKLCDFFMVVIFFVVLVVYESLQE